MKKILFTPVILVSIWGQSLFAQTDLKKAFDQNSTTFDKDPVGWVQKLPENVRFFGGDGPIFNKEQTLELVKRTASGKSTSFFADLRVKQSGNLGVASGIRTHELVFANGLKMSWKDAFTYTFEWQNNQWVNTEMQHTKLDYQTNLDEAAIKQTCENETKYFHAGDSKNWVAQWSDSGKEEYMAQDIVALAQNPYMKGEKFRAVSKAVNASAKPDGKESKMTDFQSRINGNMAWATYLQEDLKDGTSVAKAHQLRILEKQNGQWKIVALSIQKL